jgi:hypothetical protein
MFWTLYVHTTVPDSSFKKLNFIFRLRYLLVSYLIYYTIHNQGDQMSCEKIAQSVAHYIFVKINAPP